MTRPQGTTRRLPVVLEEEEVAERAQQLAKAVDAVATQEASIAAETALWAEKKKAMAGYLHHLKTEANALAAVVETGKEDQEVACSWLYALKAGAAFLVRDDTGELVTARRLSDAERQAELVEVLREPTSEQLALWLDRLTE